MRSLVQLFIDICLVLTMWFTCDTNKVHSYTICYHYNEDYFYRFAVIYRAFSRCLELDKLDIRICDSCECWWLKAAKLAGNNSCHHRMAGVFCATCGRGNPTDIALGASKTSQSTPNQVSPFQANLDELQALLECPVCTETVLPPIYQCKNGHLLCSNCRPKLNNCPTCRVPMG